MVCFILSQIAANNTVRLLRSYKDTFHRLENHKFGFDTSKVKIKENKYLGKLPSFYYLIDPLTNKDIEFDEHYYSKLSIANFNEEMIIAGLIGNIANAEKFYKVR